MNSTITVLKFGSSVLRTEDDLARVVHDIYARWRRGSQVLVVVSAFGDTTDELLDRAARISDEPHPHSVATLLATGEATSSAMLGIALDRAGIPVKVLSPEQAGLKTTGGTLDSHPIDVNVATLRDLLRCSIVIVSGFVGIDENRDTTLLGRGGSDLTALFLADRLDADCILVKDVDGLYESDPNLASSSPHRYVKANWNTALAAGDGLVQPKAIKFAREHDLEFSITSLGSPIATRVHGGGDELVSRGNGQRNRLRVALFGCGTVGAGVYRAVAGLSDRFDIVGVADRNRDKALAAGVPAHLFAADPRELLERDCDVVVELFGGTEGARDLVIESLGRRRHVVTANKALLADEIELLEAVASDHDVELRFSAAVGGVMPALETVARTEKLRSFSGILNGTCNFICDELHLGRDLDDAIHAAQVAGFAEADPTLDIRGIDAAQKLVLLARTAFGKRIGLGDIDVIGIDAVDSQRIREATAAGRVVRLIASCRLTDNGIVARVAPADLPESHAFARTRGANNCLLLETDDGTVRIVSGRGAGRWPTAEAVVADLIDLSNEVNRPVRRGAVSAAGFASVEVYA